MPADQQRLDSRQGSGHAVARPSGDADLGQWPGPGLHARHRGRRPVHVHRHRQRREQVGPGRRRFIPIAYVARDGVPKEQTSWVLHEGFVGVADGSETDANYNDFKDEGTPPKTFSSTGGWVGITDKYWMAAVIPPQNETYQRRLSRHRPSRATPRPIRPITACGARIIAPRRTASGHPPPVRRRQGGRHSARL